MKRNLSEEELFDRFSKTVEDLPKLSADPYLKTRLLANLEKPVTDMAGVFLKKPVVILWLFLLFINLMSFAWWGNLNQTFGTFAGDSAATLVEEYGLNYSNPDVFTVE